MRIWPVILDSKPSYLTGARRPTSLLLSPVGTKILLDHVRVSCGAITGNSIVVVAPDEAGDDYRRRIQAERPNVRVIAGPEECDDAFPCCELSDAFLVIDPRYIVTDDSQLSTLMREYSVDPRVAHYLVAFEPIAGTKERVNFDTEGRVRGIQRYYEQATWPFIAGISAAIVPAAAGAIGNGLLPKSLLKLRQFLAGRQALGRDLPVVGGVLDLTDKRGMLAANELFVLNAAAGEVGNGGSLFVGAGHSIHPDARLVGPVVLHSGVHIERGATVLGPAVIGAGTRIGADALVAHCTVCEGSIVPPGEIVRDEIWIEKCATTGPAHQREGLSYDERLARLVINSPQSCQNAGAESSSHRVQRALKRAFDLSVTALSLALLSPILLLSSAAIWLESRGPVFFGDKREGAGGRVFRCWKFRTMYTGAHLAQHHLTGMDQTDGPHFKMDRDPRVTRVGHVLRTLNVDELPQLYNVLVGQMSLVGPRPSPFRENQVCIPWREARLSVRPGITGFWQVCRHDRAAGDFHQWIEYDMLYVKHLSLLLDIKILLATLLTLGGKAAHVPAGWLVRQSPTERRAFARQVAPSRVKESVAA